MNELNQIAAQYAIGGASALVINGILVKAIRLAGIPSKYLPLVSIGGGMGLGMLWASCSKLTQVFSVPMRN